MSESVSAARKAELKEFAENHRTGYGTMSDLCEHYLELLAAACQTVAPPPDAEAIAERQAEQIYLLFNGDLSGGTSIRSVLANILRIALRFGAAPAVSTPPDKRAEAAFDKLMDQGFFEDVKDWPPSSRDECLEILRELAGAAVSTPRCPKCGSDQMWIDNGQVVCGNSECDWEVAFSQFFHPAPSPPQSYIGSKEEREALERGANAPSEHFVHSPEAKKIIEASREKDRKPVASPQGSRD